MPCRGVLVLDYDLTVNKNYADFYNAYCEALKAYGAKPIPYDLFVKLVNENKLVDYIPSSVSEQDFWKLFRKVYHAKSVPIPNRGLRELVYTAKNKGLYVVIVSGRENSPYYIWRDLYAIGVAGFIDNVFTLENLVLINEEEEFLFDKTALLRYCAKVYGVEPTNMIVLGDYLTDYYSASRVNACFIGIVDLPDKAEVLRKAGVELIAKDLLEAVPYVVECSNRFKC